MEHPNKRIRGDISGTRFGYLVANLPTQMRGGGGSVIWECVCDCGNIKLVSSKLLLSNDTKSCGCRSVYTIDANRAEKRCPKCGILTSILDFPKNKSSKDGHSQYCRECTRIINSENHKKEGYRIKANERQAKKYKEDMGFRLIHGMRNRVRLALHNNSKYGNTINLLGCNIPKLREHLQEQFTDEMSWENYGTFWEIDHIRPCATFDLSKIDSQKVCFHYTNLRPLSIRENRGRRINGQ